MKLRVVTFGTLSLRDRSGALTGAGVQPRRLAMLALLARAGERGVTRDKLLALIWPDTDEERARRAITQGIYALRQELGSDDALLGIKELRLNPDLVTTDVGDFAAAFAAGRYEDAVRLYAGPFLDGVHLVGNDEFERWAERERIVLAHEHSEALEKLAMADDARGDHARATGWWRRLCAKDPLSARYAVGLMQSLAAAGDKHGALEHARVHEILLEEQLDLPADREVVAMAARIRRELRAAASVAAVEAGAAVPPIAAGAAVAADEPTVASHPPPLSRETTSESSVVRQRPAWRRMGLAGGVAVGAVAVALALGRTQEEAHGRAGADSTAIVAVGRITDYTESANRRYGRPVADLLSTNLARVPGLQVVSAARMLELEKQAAAVGDTSAAAVMQAARLAGATEIVDGIVYVRPDGRLRLDLRRVGLTSGAILDAQTVEGPDLFALVDSGTARLVSAHGGRAPTPVSGATTTSAAAYRLYVEGLNAFADGDGPAAERLFAAALREDTSFAMAAYYYARTATTRVNIVARLARALRLSANASDRERLLIRAGWAWLGPAPELGALADTLVVRYPQETEGHLYAGVARLQAGDFLAAIPPLERAVAMDSLSFTHVDSLTGCTACVAQAQIVLAYELADSLSAAERAARRWTALQPKAVAPWTTLWDALERAGRFADAQAMIERLTTLDPDAAEAMDRTAAHALRTGDLAPAEQVLRLGLRAGNDKMRRDALWGLVLSLRYQGRLQEAIEFARRYRALLEPNDPRTPGAVTHSASPVATTLYESGRYREAAALFDSLSRWRAPDEVTSGAARERAWRLTHEATALAAAGDTSRLRQLADTIAAAGALSGNGRDRRLARYVIGLLQLARRDSAGAEQSFRESLYSMPGGYTRTNIELGRLLVARGRGRDAVAVLQPALRGKVDASNYYVTHTEIHEALAQAWESAGRTDSAAVHYAWVAKAWEHGDPPFARRAEEARRRSGRTPGHG
jgi:DNA-binding SARP family transcriptional activator/TolB-like protein